MTVTAGKRPGARVSRPDPARAGTGEQLTRADRVARDGRPGGGAAGLACRVPVGRIAGSGRFAAGTGSGELHAVAALRLVSQARRMAMAAKCGRIWSSRT